MATTREEDSKWVTVGPSDAQVDIPRDITHVTLQPETDLIEKYGFYGCEALVEVDAPLTSRLRIIRSQAFYNCIKLKRIAIPKTVNQINSHAFFWCESLTSISLVQTQLKTIGGYAFAYCLSLKEILLPATIKVIETCAFFDCKQLINVEFPEGLEVIMDNAFKMCNSLEIVHIPSTVTKIGQRAFTNCSKIQTVEIALERSLLREINAAAFRGCYELQNIAIPSDTLVQSDTFRLCPQLAENLAGNLPPDYDEAMTEFLKHRFDDLPLHKLCYSISYESQEIIAEKIEHLLLTNDKACWYKEYDALRKTPGHLLALASNCTQDSDFHNGVLTILYSKPIQSLGLEDWRSALRSVIVDYTNTLTREDRIFRIDEIISMFESLELMEATSLLELALWKAKMKSWREDNPNTNDASLDDPELRKECFVQCGSHTIINSILPFVKQNRAPMVPFFSNNGDNDDSISNETAISW
ncbi:unnamed protein product [Cylindrotheca closterium]|uniref:Leucine-rich repeat domain-containing protein n=1 Tax=Cylindrotheca closterium TaxID=2856 RepID=A0AAD2CI82_9STRA|nr:unnamed protein product [Cylindrotheca closterium]